MSQQKQPGPAPVLSAFGNDRGVITYPVTSTDELWMLRAVESEGPVHAEVAQVLVNRFMFLAATRPGLYPTLTSLVRAYAQPVNPSWAPGGKRYEATLRRTKTAAARAKVEAQGRRRIAHTQRSQFADHTHEAVRRALTAGISDVPASAVHYAAPGVGTRKGLISLRKGTKRNWLWASQGSRSWAGYQVVAPFAQEQPAVAGFGGLAGVGGLVVLIAIILNKAG